eukprot:GFKZ01004249.1.p1 GENE.GFKZ01004249.1~~GFKZ01004249.1.p1  ORF type:complete len:468 (+),score=56.13 GFKZ01004249.1:103-1506(+)
MQSFICHPPQLSSLSASRTLRCSPRRPVTLIESRPSTSKQSSTPPHTLPRGRGRPRKSSTFQGPAPKFQNPSSYQGAEFSESSNSSSSSTKVARKARGRPRKKQNEEATEEGGGETRVSKETNVPEGVPGPRAVQVRKKPTVTRSKVTRGANSRKSGAKSQVAPKSSPNDSDATTSASSEVYKQDALREEVVAVPELKLGESQTVKNTVRERRDSKQAFEHQGNLSGKAKTAGKGSSSTTRRATKTVSQKKGQSESSGLKGSPPQRKAAENAPEVINALDLEMGMPSEVPLVPVSRVKVASKSRKGQQQSDESQTFADKQASILKGTAQGKRNVADPTMPGTPQEVDLGGGLDEVEISRIRNLASSTRSRKPIKVSRSGIKIPADVQASRPTEVQSEEEQEQAVHASFRHAEELVEDGVTYDDGRYGICFQCGEGLVIPGVARFFCKNCGWLSREAEIKSISPGHHD